MNCTFDCDEGGAHTSMGLWLLILGALLLIVLGLAAGVTYSRYEEQDRRRKAAHTIRLAVEYQIAVALAAYGAATLPAANYLASYIRKALGPILVLADGISGPLKSIATAEKGKTKAEAKAASPTASSTAGSAAVAIVVGGTPVPAAPSTERDMTLDEQITEARKGIEGLAAFWKQPNLEEMIRNAAAVLDAPTVRPPVIMQQFSSKTSTSAGS